MRWQLPSNKELGEELEEVSNGIPVAVVHVGRVHVEMLASAPGEGALLWHDSGVRQRLELPGALMYFINILNMASTGRWFVGLREEDTAAAQQPPRPAYNPPGPPPPSPPRVSPPNTPRPSRRGNAHVAALSPLYQH
ncbi:hypothetical protein K490DRAFT_67834 [Saccharata proteae CBS 121410]|uniref:Uncharacterized protein n=1 Tax=Saccharata proteae CBS 121410 TaxID=1314787 RepID=A0A9P4HPD8_9PEZI|nr:hypothetical protein K490DRAFT_67834 [Saccharata proteae CBS 121410]